MAVQPIASNQTREDFQNYRESFILKVMIEEFGFTATQSILSHVSRTTTKSKSEILSNYDTFSRILKQVYTEEVAEREILDRLSSFGLREKS
ncbi:MAG TPA: hypothetical protein VLC72_05715 [Nitrosopumilaceae archaeon]|nr:hypothetical protein [Nitrosopumilaceae archaeon]